MSENFNVSRSFFMNWAKNWKVPIWFKRKNKNFRDFRVFDFALYPRSKTRKSQKFRLPWIMTLIIIQDLKITKKSIETKTKRFQYDLEQKGKFPRFPSFRFCSIPKIENSEWCVMVQKEKLKLPSFWIFPITKIENSEI